MIGPEALVDEHQPFKLGKRDRYPTGPPFLTERFYMAREFRRFKISVDSGHIIIGDPCYFLRTQSPGRQEKEGDGLDYRDLLDVEKGQVGQIDVIDNVPTPSSEGSGSLVFSSTGYGDGDYPVIVEMVDGRPSRITIDFENNGDEDDDYDDHWDDENEDYEDEDEDYWLDDEEDLND